MRNIIFLSLLISAVSQAIAQTPYSYVPKNGYIPNEETAIAVAVAVWKPIYGTDQIDNEKPYVATLKNGIWHVRGSLPEGWKGGVAEAGISRTNGTILWVTHGK